MVSSKTERDLIEKTGKSSQVEGGKVKNKATGKEEAKTGGRKRAREQSEGRSTCFSPGLHHAGLSYATALSPAASLSHSHHYCS